MADCGRASFVLVRIWRVVWEADVTVAERVRAVWRSAIGGTELDGARLEAAEAELARRRTLALPSILSPYGSGFGPGLNGVPKPTQANLRRFAETPLVRRAINVIKDRIVAMDWQVRVRRGAAAGVYTVNEVRAMSVLMAVEAMRRH